MSEAPPDPAVETENKASRRPRPRPVPRAGSPGLEAPLEVQPAHPALPGEIRNLEFEHAQESLRAQKAWAEFRLKAAENILKFFYRTNIGVGLFVVVLWLVETWIKPGLPTGKHLITERVVLALIAGSVAQVGALAIAVGRGLFRDR